MPNYIRGLIVIAATSMLGLATSQTAVAANTWSGAIPVDGIVALEDGGFLLLLPASNPSCGSSGNQFYVRAGYNGQTDAGIKVVLSLALTAYATAKKVSVYFDPTIATCSVRQLHLVP